MFYFHLYGTLEHMELLKIREKKRISGYNPPEKKLIPEQCQGEHWVEQASFRMLTWIRVAR